MFSRRPKIEGKRGTIPLIAVVCVALLMAVLASPLAGAGITWPASHYLPTFPTPGTIDCIDMDGLPSTQQALFSSLEGIVNRNQPRVACVSAASEGEFTWITIHNLSYDTLNGFSAIQKYITNISGLVVTDPNQADTLNLATTIAGVKNELICDPSLLTTLTNSPFNLGVKDDLRGLFANKYQVYGYLYSNYWSQCTHRVMAGLETNDYWYLRDYLIALKSAVVWLDPGVSADASTLSLFTSGMTAVDGVYLGWWPDEGTDMQWIAQYGIPVIASDFFDNASVYSGLPQSISMPAIPPTPPLQNKVYVSVTLSDGDNIQYMQHAMKMNWGSSARGTVPIGWTVQPLLADLDPGMLNYYYSTATTNDCLLAGPSGAGYARLNYWSTANAANYTKASNPYLQGTGIRMITVWLTVSAAMGNDYAGNCPGLVGINDQNGGYYTTHYGALPVIGFPGSGSYASAVSNLVNAVTNTATGWNGSAPLFVAVQGSAWNITPADCQSLASSLASINSSEYVMVRPDHLFLLYQQSLGLGAGGAPPSIATPPASQAVAVGGAASFNVIASGTKPLTYQWQRNGTNISNATGSSYTHFNIHAADTGSYTVVVTNNYGAVTSAVAVLTFGSQPLGFNGGGLNWTVNENSSYTPASTIPIAGNVLTLTDGAGSEVRTMFFNSPQYIGAFQAAFTYQAGGNKSADGVSFCLQNDPRGPAAIGGGGGQLGVGPANPITPSLDLELNLFTGSSQRVGFAVLTNGLTGASGGNGNYFAPGNVQINSGDPINITVNYSNGQMTFQFADTVAQTSFVTNVNVGDVTQLLGTNAAYVGFTGADGGSTSVQTISNFSFASRPSAGVQFDGTNALVLWTAAAPGYLLQQNSDLTTTNWINVTNQPASINGTNLTTLPATSSNVFYRLMLPWTY